ncbi:MAG: hypothetical protein OJF49_002348 [Ktedonobacterales bacterium]|jgi:hypothetical protein|nr:MAG: hypothetical protein OJF49_002348 [Ktedonobacterales bacterium]
MTQPTGGQQPGQYPYDQTQPGALNAATPTQGISPAQLAEAVRQVEREKDQRKFRRRALLGVAGLGVCAGAAALAPVAVKEAGLYTQKQLDDALSAGVEQGRQAVLNELRNLEGFALDGAIEVADLTRIGVTYIVKPLADLTSTITGDLLQVLANGVSGARDALSHINVHIGVLDNIYDLFTTWRANVTQDQLGNYAVADVTLAEAYLKALKQKIDAPTAATPTPKK